MLYLLHYQLLPEQRLAALMADLFGVKLVTATIARISQDWAHRFMGFADAVRDHVATAPVSTPAFAGQAMNETGFRIGGKTRWLHIASTVWLTFYRVSAKRGCQRSPALSCMITGSPRPSPIGAKISVAFADTPVFSWVVHAGVV